MSKQNNEKDKHKTTQKNIDKHEHYEGRVLNKFWYYIAKRLINRYFNHFKRPF